MELKASELRVGNYINYKGDPIRVTMVGEYGIQSNDGDKVINAKYFGSIDLESIPLTEEWLLKFEGVEETIYDNFRFEFNAAIYTIEKQDDWFFIGVRHSGTTTYFVWHIKYVHTFQNVIFALTGQELTIK